MNYKMGLGAMVVILALWNPGARCAAQGVPSGSYQQSCRDVGVSGSTLYARCQDRSGNWQDTQLTYYQNCVGDIVNDNGTLRCSQNSVQGGSYTQSCRNIRVRGSRLEAECQRRDRGWNRTVLDNYDQCTGDIINDNGTLVCTRAQAPAGTYAQSCRNIRLRGSRLEAECQRRDRGWNRTSLDNYDQCTGDIVNDNGTLECTRTQVRSGSYTQSCRNIRLRGNRLEAECQAANREWNRTWLENYQQCTGDIFNDNGTLRCGGSQGGRGVPSGPYTQTCRNIRMDGDTLEAECQNRGGQWKRAVLEDADDCRGQIINENGKLRCRRDED